MSKYINADALKIAINRNMDMQDLYLPYEFIELINEMPESIVRCKDCKYFIKHAEDYISVEDADGMCDFYDCGMKRLDFCSYAERKEAEK